MLDGGQGRSLLLWARGGMGKTMHVRWLIARQCVPRPDSVPCARVDFDFVEPRTAAREPWLLLLEMAAQLDPQLALEPFDPLLSQYGHHRRRLEPRVRSERGASTPGGDGTGLLAADAIDDLRQRFISALRERPAGERVLLVLDTLEVALLPWAWARSRPDRPRAALLRELAAVHDAAPCVRLLLAGRYDLAEWAPRVRVLLPDAHVLELKEFGSDQVRQYLLEARAIDRADLVDAVAHASGGVPLKVALIADVIEQDPLISGGKGPRLPRRRHPVPRPAGVFRGSIPRCAGWCATEPSCDNWTPTWCATCSIGTYGRRSKARRSTSRPPSRTAARSCGPRASRFPRPATSGRR